MPSVRRSLLLSFLQKYCELLIGFVASVVLARLLLPEEVGLYSVIAAVTVLAHMFRDFGVSTFVVREPELTPSLLSAAFAVTLAWSYAMGALLLLGTELLVAFFGREELREVIRVVSLTFFVIPFGSIWLGVLRKNMAFGTLLKINVGSAFIGATTSILLAANHFSYMSLAWGSLVGTVSTVVLANLYRPAWSTCLPLRRDLKRVLAYGSKASYTSLIQQVAVNLPDMLVGKYFGMSAAGLYSRANGVVKLFHIGFMQGLLPVLLPHMANRLKDTGRIDLEHLKISRNFVTISLPFFAFLILFSDIIILVLFGANWVPAAPLVAWLAAAAAIESTVSLNGNLFMALNRMDELARSSTISQGSTILFVAAGAMHSLQALLAAIVASRVLTMITSNYFACRLVGITARQIVSNLRQPIIVTAICALASPVLGALGIDDGTPAVAHLFAAASLFAAAWVFALWIVGSDLFAEAKRLIAVGIGRKPV